MKSLMIALLALSFTGCAHELVDVLSPDSEPREDEDSDDEVDPGSDPGPGTDDTPEACVVGEWSVSGDTGIGDCYSLFGVIIEHRVRFEQDGDQMYVYLVEGDGHELVSAGYDESPNGCSAGFQITAVGSDFDIYYSVSVASGNVFGTAVLSASFDGYECEQAWEVVGVVAK